MRKSKKKYTSEDAIPPALKLTKEDLILSRVKKKHAYHKGYFTPEAIAHRIKERKKGRL